MGRAERVTRALKTHDYKLYCDKDMEGKLCVYRQSQRTETYEVNGSTIHFVRPAPHFIFALTDNWKTNGSPRDWGIEPIMNRIREGDTWGRDIAEECIRQTEKKSEKDARTLRNESEAFLKDWRRGFAKQFGDVNTSSLKKIDSRYLGDKKYVNR